VTDAGLRPAETPRPISRLRAWLTLSPRERRDAVRAALLVCGCSLGLRALGVRRMMTWAARPARRRVAADDRATIDAAVRAVSRVARHSPAPGTCLSRSLALQRWLSQAGVDSTIHLGGRVAGGALDAHAWLEWNGTVLTDGPDVERRFPPLVRVGPGSSAGRGRS
jgi:hypothetical protein